MLEGAVELSNRSIESALKMNLYPPHYPFAGNSCTMPDTPAQWASKGLGICGTPSTSYPEEVSMAMLGHVREP